ncbi:HTH lysR-type domain-containing protein [Bordetella sputigena]|uniref:LysR family transcriptional regulator n=1 Tax=Bordetella sputigena TaxID=1416810 RepID=UPI0039EE04A7
MNLKALRYFVAIADTGSFTAAAALVRIAQPALSRHVRELESELGVTLLRRSARGALLTQEGAALCEAARRILAEAEQVKTQLTARAQMGQSTITVGASPTLGRVLLPGLFERCDSALGGFRIALRESFTPILSDWLERGLVDVAFLTNPDGSRDFALHHLYSEPFALITAAPRRFPATVTIAELADIPLLMTRFHRNLMERQLGVVGGRLNVHAEIDSVESISELVMQGRWATVMPVSVFSRQREARTVALTEVSGVQLNRLLMLAVRRDGRANPGIALFTEIVKAECAELVAKGVFSFSDGPRMERGRSDDAPANAGDDKPRGGRPRQGKAARP